MTDSDLSRKIRAQIGNLPPTMRRVAQYMERNRVEVVALSAAEMGEALGTSDATIIRTAKSLGYSGLAELKRILTRELSTGSPTENFRRTVSATKADSRRAFQHAVEAAQREIGQLLDGEALDVIERMIGILDDARRIFLFGIGPMAHVTGYAALQLGRIGRDVALLDRTGRDLADQMLHLGEGDVLLLLSFGHPYAEVLAVVEEGLIRAVPMLLVSNSADNPLIRRAQETVLLPRGGTHGVALNAAVFAFVEALVVGLSVRAPERADEALKKLEAFRASLDRLG